MSLTVALAVTLAACGGSGDNSSSGGSGSYDKNATVNIGSLYEPQNLDNTAGGGQGVTEALNGNVYEGLFKLTDDGKVENLLAKDYKVSGDGLTYTFTLRDGVKFHSGKALTSKDVKYSLEKVIAPDSQSARKSNLEVIKAIDTPDAKTVKVTLSQKSISFVYNLSYVWIINDEAKNLKTTEDGTGPYKLGKWTRGSALSLDRFPGYWGTAATNKQVVFHYYKDATALNNALLTNAVDVVTSEQSPDALDQFKSNQSYKVNDGNSTTKLLLAFNDKAKPFTDVKVRKAVSSAIDDKKLLESIWGGLRQGDRVDGAAHRPLVRGPDQGQRVRPDRGQEAARGGRLREGLHLHARHPELRPAPDGRRPSSSRSSPRSASPSRSTRSRPTSGTRRSTRTTTSRPRCRSTSTTATSSGTATPTSTGATTTSRSSSGSRTPSRRRRPGEQTDTPQEGQPQDRRGRRQRLAVPVPADRRRQQQAVRLPGQRPELAVLRLRHQKKG